VAGRGQATLELMGNIAEKIDLLITDVAMPKRDGPGLIGPPQKVAIAFSEQTRYAQSHRVCAVGLAVE
jgi:hypothetical protein